MKFIKAVFNLIFVAVIVAALAAVAGFFWLDSEVTREGPSADKALFTVEAGDSVSSVAARLEADGLIRSAQVMRIKARLDGAESELKTGDFEIKGRASIEEILAVLIKGTAVQNKITIPEGRTTAQILKLIAGNDQLTGDVPLEIPEGELLPDTYFFQRGMTRADLVKQMSEAQDELIERLWPTRAEGLPINTPEEAIVLASVVEKETGRADEQPQIAGLFVSRLKIGMRLQSDPTIIYGISKGEPLYNAKGERRTLRRSEIDKQTAWNTYQIDGLPPTPICNPGRGAIEAVLNPDETGHLFFVADGKGGHLFAKTNAEHNDNVAKYRAFERAEIERERAN